MSQDNQPGQPPPAHATTFISLLEPESLVDAFLAHPPQGFSCQRAPSGMPTFVAPFDLLTTAEKDVRVRIQRLPLYRWWGRLLQWKTRFAGCTITEYAPLPRQVTPQELAQELHRVYRREQRLLIVKDIAEQSPLLSAGDNAYAQAFAQALQERGFVLLEGMALAWVPVDYASSADYISRLSAARRADMRRKLKARAGLEIEEVPTGDQRFDDAATVGQIYALYLHVYAQSEVHFDLLSEALFAALLRDRDSGGVLFTFRHAGELIGWKLCFVHGGMLLDKYVGFAYPQAREHNLYFVSWFHCLDVARERGLTHFVASTTDTRVKRYLGATLTRTRNAVYVRNWLFRALLRRLAHHFENEPD